MPSPFRRHRTSQRDMIALGGWIFADLLLGLAMLFFTANTVGQPPPTPTPVPPTATPNLLATSQATIAALSTAQAAAAVTLAENDREATVAALTAEALGAQVARSNDELATAAARATEDAYLRLQATATAEAAQTVAAMSAAERASADARASETAVAAAATLAAFATQQAADQSTVDRLTSEQATAAARATIDALNARDAQATMAAQGTAAARVAAVATENAAGGANALATSEAAAQQAQAAAQQSEAEAQQAAAEATSAAATIAALNQSQVVAVATTTALAQIAADSALNPDAAVQSITVDPDAISNGDPDAVGKAQQDIRNVLAPYQQCRAGFVLISAGGTDLSVSSGLALAEKAQGWVQSVYPQVFGKSGFDRVAWTTDEKRGNVEFKMFFNAGCAAAANG